jgi:hypothetical protein
MPAGQAGEDYWDLTLGQLPDLQRSGDQKEAPVQDFWGNLIKRRKRSQRLESLSSRKSP